MKSIPAAEARPRRWMEELGREAIRLRDAARRAAIEANEEAMKDWKIQKLQENREMIQRE